MDPAVDTRVEIDQHGRRTAWLTERLCALLDVGASESRDWAIAAMTHDIGKLDIPARLLSKPGPLDPGERTRVERHCVDGARRLLLRARPDSHHSTTASIAVALSHHEWWNGAGYPFGLKATAIPRCARVVAVADVVDALTSVRTYKSAWSLPAALDEVAAGRGGQFDPECIDAMQILARTLPADWRAKAQGWRPPVSLEAGVSAMEGLRADGECSPPRAAT